MNETVTGALASSHPAPVTTRFAPSPTGRIHIGGVRTALYNWLYARRHGGRFLLRIEDTDRERSLKIYERHIIEGLRWLGLDWDEEPIRQSERTARYHEILKRLLDNGSAYRCVCTQERLARLREEQMARNIKPGYDGRCRRAGIEASDGRPFVVRLLTPEEGTVAVHDTLRNEVRVANRELDDMILARSDGTPTYQLSAVVDDIDSNISHIIRGDDHLNNTLRQAHLYRALDAATPVYTHLPLILDEDGRRYSKRSAGADLSVYRRRGVVPEALLNYLLRLGWSHGDQEYFTPAQMVELFNLEGLNRSACTFNPGKLDWLNRRHIQSLDTAVLRERTVECLAFINTDDNGGAGDSSDVGADDNGETGGSAEAVGNAGIESGAFAKTGAGGTGSRSEAGAYTGRRDKQTADRQSVRSGVVSADVKPDPAIATPGNERRLGEVLSDAILEVARAKAADLIELLNLSAPLLEKNTKPTANGDAQYAGETDKSLIQTVRQKLEQSDDWSASALSAQIKAFCKEKDLKMPQLAMPLRFALLGRASRLGVSDILYALGKTESLARIHEYLGALSDPGLGQSLNENGPDKNRRAADSPGH